MVIRPVHVYCFMCNCSMCVYCSINDVKVNPIYIYILYIVNDVKVDLAFFIYSIVKDVKVDICMFLHAASSMKSSII